MKKFLAICFLFVSISFGKSYDINFYGFGEMCAKISGKDGFWKMDGSECSQMKSSVLRSLFQSVRVRVLDAPQYSSSPGFRLERPFLIVDGIHLDPENPRSLSDFEKDVEAYGLPTLLKSLGYTPMLIQFPQTVNMELEVNGKNLAKVLQYFAKAKVIPWTYPNQDGFVVFGISQGGVLGRYGSYLYDISKKSDEAPVRFFASLDSPHQGAVIPRGILATINFWAGQGIRAAEDFADLVSAPGAKELLLYDTEMGLLNMFGPRLDSDRWLLNDYRKAAEYKGFPSILLSEGQIFGKLNSNEKLYFELNRYAEKFSKTFGRAVSRVSYSESEDSEFSYNRVYESPTSTKETKKGKTPFDRVQGSVYPFGEMMYSALREGMLEEMPENMKQKIPLLGSISISTKWDSDELKEGSSTFIPTTSALDLKCDGKLSVLTDCVRKQTESGLKWENPGSRSTGSSIYAVDATHPRSSEKMSGRHIEFPEGKKNVLAGIQTDMWRLLCELAKSDFDESSQEFRNSAFMGFFDPTVSCLDQSKMPPMLKNAGVLNKQKFSWVRYDFHSQATEREEEVSFALPAGWQKSVRMDYGKGFPAGSIVEVQVKMENPKANWLKAEFMLTRQKNGGSQIQLEELTVKPDGSYYTLRWRIPGTDEALKNYRWGRLILNSAGGQVSLKGLRIIKETIVQEVTPQLISSSKLYPNSGYRIIPWKKESQLENGTLDFYFEKAYDGVFLDLTQVYSFKGYKNLEVAYEAGSCQDVRIYFDALLSPKEVLKLGNGKIQNNQEILELPLDKLIDVEISQDGGLSASKLILQAGKQKTSCAINSIQLK